MSPFWTRARHLDRAPFLSARAAIVRGVRDWFHGQGFTEVEPQALALSPGAEVHVDAFESDGRYLHTSPEFAMKKLLAAGEEKIFFLGKCWRRGETSPLHAEEFTMLEWYRAGADYELVMNDCVELARVTARAASASTLRWRERECNPFFEPLIWQAQEAFKYFAGIDLAATLVADGPANRDALAAQVNDNPDFQDRVAPIRADESDTWSDIFSKLVTLDVEPQLGWDKLAFLTEYPAPQAALARRCAHDARFAERFELYACGVELANGFGELTDPVEQRARLIEAMAEKQKRYGKSWPIDEDFLAALAYMPPASGAALGLDRLVMLASGARHINDVLWSPIPKPPA